MEVYLGIVTDYKILRPGAVHTARWMSKQLYSYKLVILRHQLPDGIVTQTQINKMERFVQFCTFVLNEWWFNCPDAASAPRQDLSLFQQIRKYKEIDEEVAKSAEKAFLRHTWYLVGEMIPLALWDTDLKEEQRRGLADAITNTPESSSFTDRIGSGWGKPNLKAVDVTKSQLGDYVTVDSNMFFKTLKISSSFLSKPVKEWKDDTCYKNGATVLKYFSYQ